MTNEEMIKAIRSGDSGLIYELWSANMPLISQTVKKYECPSFPEEADGQRNQDLIQESYLCLIESLPEYDSDRGKFITFYLSRLRWWLFRVVNENTGINVPAWLTVLQGRYNRYIQDYYQIHGCYPDDETITQTLDISYKTLETIRNVNPSVKSLDVPVSGSDDLELWETIQDNSAAVSDLVTDDLHKLELKSIWNICKDNLTRRECEVVTTKYQKEKDPAENLKLSRQRCYDLEQSAFDKLRRVKRVRELADVNISDLQERGFYLGGYTRYKHNIFTSCVEKQALKNASRHQRRKPRPQNADLKALEQELIDFFGVPS